jgi:hypothetical protein
MSDFRIGNWVKTDLADHNVKITSIEDDLFQIEPGIANLNGEVPIYQMHITERLPEENLIPIPITDDILKFFGFIETRGPIKGLWYYKKNVIPHGFKEIFYASNKSLSFVNFTNGFIYKLENGEMKEICSEIIYFHQLQNVFFDETGIGLF